MEDATHVIEVRIKPVKESRGRMERFLFLLLNAGKDMFMPVSAEVPGWDKPAFDNTADGEHRAIKPTKNVFEFIGFLPKDGEIDLVVKTGGIEFNDLEAAMLVLAPVMSGGGVITKSFGNDDHPIRYVATGYGIDTVAGLASTIITCFENGKMPAPSLLALFHRAADD